MGFNYCEDNDPSLTDMEQQDIPDVNVILSVNTDVKGTDVLDNSVSEPFACHECTNCDSESDSTIRVCESGINMCYVNLFPNFFILNFLIFFFRQCINVLIK